MTPLDAVAHLRGQLWQAGFRPVAVYTDDKRPRGNNWAGLARGNPPAAVSNTPEPEALNTGILCDGLRALDLDIDDAVVAAEVRTIAERAFGRTIVRSRNNSPRVLLLYRAAEGAPAKRQIAGLRGKVEVLGRGQQFVSHGLHPSGAALRWHPAGPGPVCRREVLPRLGEARIETFFNIIGPVIVAAAPAPPPPDKPVKPAIGLSRYAEAALDNAANAIATARPGDLDRAINGAAYGLGRLAGAGAMPQALALRVLHHAASKIPGYSSKHDGGKVDRSFANGMSNPREALDG